MEPDERIRNAATGAMSAARSQAVGGAEENPSPTAIDARTVEAFTAACSEMAEGASDEII